MNVAFIIDSLETGGAENILISIANNLSRDCLNIHFIATRVKGSLAYRLNDDICVHELNKKPGWDFKAAKRLREITSKNKIDIIHSHTHPSSYFITFAFMFHDRRFKHILHSHYGPIYSNRIVRIKDKLFLCTVDHVVTTSGLLYDYFTRNLRFTEKNCSLIDNGIIIPDSLSGFKKDTSGYFQILQTASINRNKNQLFSLKICALLKERGFAFRWVFAGNYSRDQNYYLELKDFIHCNSLNEFIEFKGEVSDIWTLIKQSNIGVLTSNNESMPLSAIEYISGQLPCIFTPKGYLIDLVEQFNTCFLLHDNDSEGWASKIISLSRQIPALHQSLTLNALKAREQYGLNNMIEKVTTVYSKLIGIN